MATTRKCWLGVEIAGALSGETRCGAKLLRVTPDAPDKYCPDPRTSGLDLLDELGGNAAYDGVGSHVLRDHGASRHDGAFADRHAGQDRGA